MSKHQSLWTFFTLLTLASGSFAAAVDKNLSLSPGSPSASWSVSLPASATSTVTVNLSESEDVNGVTYVLDPGSTKVDVSSKTGNVAWAVVSSDNPAKAKIVNTAQDDSQATVKITCTWKAQATGGGTGGGAPPTIKGVATATATLTSSTVSWELEPASQFADGTMSITYKATVYDVEGNIDTAASVQSVTAVELDPSNADWDVPAATASSGVISGTAKPKGGSIGSKSLGKLELKYNNLSTASTSPALTFFTLVIQVSNLSEKKCVFTPQNLINNQLSKLEWELDRIEQKVVCDPPGAIDLSSYQLEQHITAASYKYEGSPDINGTPSKDGSTSADQILYDRAATNTGPDLKLSPCLNTFLGQITKFKTSLTGSPYSVPAKAWGWEIKRRTTEQVADKYKSEFSQPVDVE